MKIIDEKGKIFKLINIVDLLVILAIILVIGGVFYSLTHSGAINVAPKDMYVATIKCPEVTKSVYDNLKKDDRIIYGNSYVNGYVSEVSIESAKIEVITDDNKIIYIEHPSLYDVYVDVVIEVDHGSTFILLGKYQINIGKEFVVKTAKVEVVGSVIDLKEYHK